MFSAYYSWAKHGHNGQNYSVHSPHEDICVKKIWWTPQGRGFVFSEHYNQLDIK